MNKSTTTIGEFIIDNQKDFQYATGEFSNVLSSIRLAAKIVNDKINKAGLAKSIMGDSGETNIQGETQKKLDVFANDMFITALNRRGVVCGVASEENDNYIDYNNPNGKYIVAIDPLDGSSNIDVNVSIGTIFSIYNRVSKVGSPITEEDFLQTGTAQIAAGYILYGSSTMLVYTTGNGVNGFTYDPSIGVFYLSHPNMMTPQNGAIYSVNEGNNIKSSLGFNKYIDYIKQYDPSTNRPYSSRYIGSLVADFHRNLIKGGIYIYLGNSETPNGKLRLLYECNPLALLIEQAGGIATTGNQRILDIVPNNIHQRVPLIIGSKNMVEELEGFLNEKY